jgi:hypothetical protein
MAFWANLRISLMAFGAFFLNVLPLSINAHKEELSPRKLISPDYKRISMEQLHSFQYMAASICGLQSSSVYNTGTQA